MSPRPRSIPSGSAARPRAIAMTPGSPRGSGSTCTLASEACMNRNRSPERTASPIVGALSRHTASGPSTPMS